MKRTLLSFRVVTVGAGPAAGLRIGLRHASADYGDGTNELPVQLAFQRSIRPGQTVFDVGSNVGFFALLAARLVGPGGSVHAFEAVPACAKALSRNVARNGFANVTVHAVAVGQQRGQIELMQGRHPGGATTSTADRPQSYVGSILVPSVALDEMIAAAELPTPDFVKIDVEGAEPEVLRGMETTLARAAPIVVCELDDPTDEGAATKVDRVRQILERHRYRIEELEPSYEASRSRVVHLVAAVDGAPGAAAEPS